MGRWGDGIYDSDASLNFVENLRDRLIKEMVFWMSPEQVSQSAKWLTEVLTVIEIVLIFDELNMGAITFYEEDILTRWNNLFFSVWDAEWDIDRDNELPYSSVLYRTDHRHIAQIWFNRLFELVRYWSSEDLDKDLEPFIPKEKLPYFSAVRVKNRLGEPYLVTGTPFHELLQFLTREIIFRLSDENRKNAIGFFEIEYVWVAADVIAVLCERYELSPSLKVKTIDRWLEKVISLWVERFIEEEMTQSDAETAITGSQLYTNVLRIFDRLKILAEQYPHWNSL